MALTLTGGTNSHISFTTTGLTDFPYGTAAAVIWLTSIPGAGLASSVIFLGTGINADTIDILNIYGTPAGAPGYWNQDSNTDCKAPAGTSSGRWLLVAVGKDTGTVAPRTHTFDYSTGTWAHANATATSANAAATAQATYQIGGLANAVFPGIVGEVAATGAWYKRNLSDSEVERLAAGSWNKYSPDTLCEFRSSGRTPLNLNYADHGRERMRMTAFGSSIARASRVDPPGFRFSMYNRRR